jgi:hypothetical protein
MARGTTTKKRASGTQLLSDALKDHSAALAANTKALNTHTAVMTAHAIAMTPADARGACTIVFADDRRDYCADNKTNSECQELAAEMRGVAQPVIPGQRCSAK